MTADTTVTERYAATLAAYRIGINQKNEKGGKDASDRSRGKVYNSSIETS